MKIQEAAKRTGFPKRTIHYYIKEGLIRPETDQKSGYYDFSEEDCQRLLLIRQYRNAGLSLSIIRPMLDRPVMAGYYLNLYAEQLRQGKAWLNKTLDSMNYILEALPLNPDFSALYEISQNAGIPDAFPIESSEPVSTYSAELVNRCVWSGFLGNEPLNEYQQFLWKKLHRMTEYGNQDYQLISNYLQSLSPGGLAELFCFYSHQYSQAAALKEEDLEAYADGILASIHEVLWKPGQVAYWKQYYHTFFAPITRIYASDISYLVAEMSPFFMDYRKNILQVCEIAYQKLHTVESALLDEMKHVLGDTIEIEGSNHGELVCLATLPELYQKKK